MTRVLVAGGAGYIGSHACKALARAGFMPVTLDSLINGHEQAVRWGPLVKGDLGDRALLGRLLTEEKIEAVMHFAAYLYVGESVEQPAKYYANNVTNTLGLLDAMRDAGISSIVFSSSAATYGTPERNPIPEDHPQLPINPYGETKLAVERALKWYGGAYGIRWAALRYFNAAGADPDGETGEAHDPETHLVPLVLEAGMGKRPPVKLFGTDYPTPDGTAVRDYVHVSDLADAHVLALKRLMAGGESLAANLGTGDGYSVRQILDEAGRALGSPIPHENAPRRAGDPAELVADPSLAMRELGWKPTRSDLPTILKTALAWHRR
ncbi:UDP-glucose 4-epimerase GalE [Inquilinus sp. CAU 1745]|uniref:UDP-glucose 4-epimerase GalE n=1 Tax=Inquilinus sp. CAU 1745 TaxID=3140369 RepID=UPI00325A5F48